MAKDILLNDALGLQIVNGDFVSGESDAQHIALLLSSRQGDWHFSPFTGVKVDVLLNEDDSMNFTRLANEVRKQLTLDGASIDTVNIGIDKTEIDASWE